MPQEAINPAIYKLQQHKIEEAIAEDKAQYDCTPCRLMGAGAFIGLGAYTYLSGQHQIKQQEAVILKSGSKLGLKARQGMITTLAIGLVGLGVYRLKN